MGKREKDQAEVQIHAFLLPDLRKFVSQNSMKKKAYEHCPVLAQPRGAHQDGRSFHLPSGDQGSRMNGPSQECGAGELVQPQ